MAQVGGRAFRQGADSKHLPHMGVSTWLLLVGVCLAVVGTDEACGDTAADASISNSTKGALVCCLKSEGWAS